MRSRQAKHFPLVPAKAGTQFFVSRALSVWLWIPAFAGMSGEAVP